MMIIISSTDYDDNDSDDDYDDYDFKIINRLSLHQQIIYHQWILFSIETDRIADAVRHPETIRIAAELRAKYMNKKVIVGVDVCQRLSGVGE